MTDLSTAAPRLQDASQGSPEAPTRLSAWLRWASRRIGVEAARRLLTIGLGLRATEPITAPERELDPQQRAQLMAWLDALEAGQPLGYLLGQVDFWGLSLAVGPGVLIPRPDSERLVAIGLELLPAGPVQIFEPCTGSGAIALALAHARPDAKIVASELCPAALAYARANLERFGTQAVELRRGDLYSVLDPTEQFDLIVANPPYLAAHDAHLPSLAAEPYAALVAGPLGSECIARLCRGAVAHLRLGAWLVFEHGYDQGPAARAWLAHAGFHSIHTWRDLDGRQERVSGGQFAGKRLARPGA